MVEVGLEVWAREPQRWIGAGERVGLLWNPASVGRDLRSAREVAAERLGGRLRALFGPQHGVCADLL